VENDDVACNVATDPPDVFRYLMSEEAMLFL